MGSTSVSDAERILRLEKENARLAGRVDRLTIAIDKVRGEKSRLYFEVEELKKENAELRGRLAEYAGQRCYE